MTEVSTWRWEGMVAVVVAVIVAVADDTFASWLASILKPLSLQPRLALFQQ